MITEFNKNYFNNKSNLIVFSNSTVLTNTNFYYKKGGGPLYDMGPYYLTTLIKI